jgi:uncharacterized phage protein (TIGR01671 family)
MREIKFRGKAIFDGEWLHGFLFRNFNEDGELAIQGEPIYGNVNPDTIGQFTGLCDRNGTEVYEGDIVRFVFSPKLLNDIFVGVVVFCENMRWALIVGNADYGDKEYHIEHAVKYGEVIGNIHDDKHLLEAKDE